MVSRKGATVKGKILLGPVVVVAGFVEATAEIGTKGLVFDVVIGARGVLEDSPCVSG